MGSDDIDDLTGNHKTLPRMLDTLRSSAVPKSDRQSGGHTDPSSWRSATTVGAGRYTETQRVLGAGGMGTVAVVRDEKIGREVALKLMVDHARDDTNARTRFLREAQIQACLEHPAIVPVYDMGEQDDAEPYFTMKRVRGQSLAQVLRTLRAGEYVEFSRRKLLHMLGQVAVAAHYAHERGVVHRDIKPANIMLGPYGEVYLIDWGVAKVLGEDEELGPGPAYRFGSEAVTDDGDIVGSLVTMAPEQSTGGPVDARADVYALGAVLFEVLTLQPLHPRGSAGEIAAAVTAGIDARASVRAPEANVPSELEALCVAATRRDPAERIPSAHAFARALQAYLDNENEEQLRRTRSEEHAARGKRFAEQALGIAPASKESSPALESSLRSQALREVGRALALDAANKGALATLVTILTTPPQVVPEEVRLAQTAARAKQVEMAGVIIIGCQAVLIALALPLYSMEMRDGRWLGAALAFFFGAAIAGIVTRVRPSLATLFVSCLSSLSACVLAAVVVGGLTPVIPSILLAQVIGLSLVNRPLFRAGVVAFSGICWAVIMYGPSAGLLPQTVSVSNGDLVVHSAALAFDPTWFPIWTFVAFLAAMITMSVAMGATSTAIARAEDHERLRAWQLRQLIEDDTT